MPVSLAQVVFDCSDAAQLASFWSAVLERPVDDGASPFFATVTSDGVKLMFLKVPEGKSVKNRLHVDLTGPSWRDEVARLQSLGAELVSEHDEYGTQWVSFRDPEGNEFDLGGPH